VAITILRATGRHGRSVILKVRSPLTDNDDFGKFSFLSARLLEEDLAAALSVVPDVLADAEAALDDLWFKVGSPDPFLVPEAAFLASARRDVFATTGLELATDRFKFRGMQILSREDTGLQLGFAVLTVDLDRAEVQQARQSNSALREVILSQLYTSHLPMNRFLTKRKEWLLSQCLGADVI
jgi:hypothetical protein